ncbi:MAG: 3-methylornithine--L-lysine ligase PylC [Clostridiaceae bacterium]|nr:3-methylornithine--L-lysine ligase PylC [Clostridiaceae bacterium]
MTRILVIGAKLQGVEAMYLARKAGYYVMVADRNDDAPGMLLADEAFIADVYDEKTMSSLFQKADAVLPAIEDINILTKLEEYGGRIGTPVIFDKRAYSISCSKQNSNALFVENQLPIPAVYPDCGYPVILKPDGLSGSRYVQKAYSPSEVEAYLAVHGLDGTVIQEYLEGPSYSLEVLGDGQNAFFPQITEVICDRDYDCKRIIAPAQLSQSEEQQMLAIGESLARSLNIKGIFDIEVISHHGQLKLLEIDARLPSQTPISVYHATGMNMVEMLVDMAQGHVEKVRVLPSRQVCVYQQIQVGDGQINVLGEHIMSTCRHLRVHKGFFGSTEAITDYTEGSLKWKAIVITTGADRLQAQERFLDFIACVKRECGIADWGFIEG